MASQVKDRFLELLKSSVLNGIDFVELIPADPKSLRVHFINTVSVDEPKIAATIDGGDRIPSVPVKPINAADWSKDAEGRPLLTLHVEALGDHSNYTLSITSSKLDRSFRQITFSFFALCPSDFDCAKPATECGPDDGALPPIDYLAKDYLSFKHALSDFSALRYPEWQERSEADFGMTFLEALSGLADDLSYYQDRIAAEATLETAAQRRSIVRLARMVDYEPRPATSATALLSCQVKSGPLPAGLLISATLPDGTVIPFEVGLGLSDTSTYIVDARWNLIGPPMYWWDDKERCLLPGATEMFVPGRNHGFYKGQAILIDTPGASTADPPIREIVHLTADGEELVDPLFNSADATRLVWSSDEAIVHGHDLTRTSIKGNIVPVTQGRRTTDRFAIDNAPAPFQDVPLAVMRTGMNSSEKTPIWDYLHSLRQGPLVWLAQPDPQASPLPEIQVNRLAPETDPWTWIQTLLNADEFAPVFTIEPSTWRTVGANLDNSLQYEYDGDQGETIRFGNSEFGVSPDPGDVFEVTYRVGAGAAGNVASDAISIVDPAWASLLLSASNPFPASRGADRETSEQVHRLAPQAFRERQFRAVLAEDYQAAAEELPWVEQAGTAFRWTGSWLTVFTTPDPKAGGPLTVDRHVELIHLLNRRRLAGYESYAPPPRYVSVDLRIHICARTDAFRGDVEAGVLNRLGNSSRRSGASGFFFADHFTFGTPLDRSHLEAAIQEVFGVNGVLAVEYRRRGFVPSFIDLPYILPLANDEILRIDNDPSFPERGSIQVVVEGGK